jgi:hypothetical protein
LHPLSEPVRLEYCASKTFVGLLPANAVSNLAQQPSAQSLLTPASGDSVTGKHSQNLLSMARKTGEYPTAGKTDILIVMNPLTTDKQDLP